MNLLGLIPVFQYVGLENFIRKFRIEDYNVFFLFVCFFLPILFSLLLCHLFFLVISTSHAVRFVGAGFQLLYFPTKYNLVFVSIFKLVPYSLKKIYIKIKSGMGHLNNSAITD